MADLFLTHRGVVYPWQCDHVGHMNVMYYVGKFDEATWQMFYQIGVTLSYLRDNQRGVAAVRQNITYRRELRAGDVISILTGVLEGLDAVDWGGLYHAYGGAEDVPGLLRLACSEDGETVSRALSDLHGNLFHQGTVYPATTAAVPFLAELSSAAARRRDEFVWMRGRAMRH